MRLHFTALFTWICGFEIFKGRAMVTQLNVSIAAVPPDAPGAEEVVILCKGDQPLTSCQFHLFNLVQYDLSQGNMTPSDTEFDYFGHGLEKGDCGIRLKKIKYTYNLYGCRVRSTTSDWTYAELMVFHSSFTVIQITTDKSQFILPNSSATFRISTNLQLKFWSLGFTRSDGILSPHVFNYDVNKSQQKIPNNTPGVSYNVAGMSNGKCEATVNAMAPPYNHGIITEVHSTTNSRLISFFRIISPEIPPFPTFHLNTTVDERGNATLHAWCSTTGRTTVTISWLMEGEKLSAEHVEYVRNDSWTWPSDLRTVQQKLTLKLAPRDEGKTVWCATAHEGYPLRAWRSHVYKVEVTRSFCSSLKSKSVLFSCSRNGSPVTCMGPLNIGTVVYMECRPSYTMSPMPYSIITCLSTGQWDQPLFSCKPPVCGKRKTNSGHVLVSSGVESKIGEFPWHVAVYEVQNQSTEFLQMCSGTLISVQFVVSAAHCYWDTSEGLPKNASAFRVATGKHHRQWDHEELAAQKRSVSRIILPLRYRGRTTNFGSDIALLRLSEEVDINPSVSLVCMNWSQQLEEEQLAHGNMGTVAGWGITEDAAQSDVLKYVNLPYVDDATCIAALPETQHPLFTIDKFCAGYVNTTISACRGDSGGGIVFRHPRSNRYYLRGIVSVAFGHSASNGCFTQLYSGFTRVSSYGDWINKYVNGILA